MKYLILLLTIIPTLTFAVSNKGVERESRPVPMTVLPKCQSLRYRFNSNYLRCLHKIRKKELEAKRRLRSSIKGRSLRTLGTFRGSRSRNKAVFTAKSRTVSRRPIRRTTVKRYTKKEPKRQSTYRGIRR